MYHHSKTDLNRQQTEALSVFEKWIEDYFLADTKIYDCSSEKESTTLGVEISLGFDFFTGLSMLLSSSGKTSEERFSHNTVISNFRERFLVLSQSFDTQVDIKEISLYFRETAIVINKSLGHSILDNLEEMLLALRDHFSFYCNIVSEVPAEIHIPAVEHSHDGSDAQISLVASSHYASPYLAHWAFYFHSLDSAFIYDLGKMSFIPADLGFYPT